MSRQPSAYEAGTKSVRVAIVGGGLAGLAAAVALADSRTECESRGVRLEIELFESRRMLGGRATSYLDPETGELIDNCQHVSLGCCTNFDDFCRRVGATDCLRTIDVLQFCGPAGRTSLVSASARLGAPFHLASSLTNLNYLSLRERLSLLATLRRLAKTQARDDRGQEAIGTWLRGQGQSERAIELFWTPIIVSALAEVIDRASVAAARKVFVDAFFRHPEGYKMRVPAVPLTELYDHFVVRRLETGGVRVHLGAAARRIVGSTKRVEAVELAGGQRLDVAAAIVAVPWFRVDELFDGPIRGRLPFLQALQEFEPSPITSVHLWFDRPLFDEDHLVLPGRLSQWVFRREGSGAVRSAEFGVRSEQPSKTSAAREWSALDRSHYYQVVISGSRELAAWSRDEIVASVTSELRALRPEASDARLLSANVITEHRAVFSPKPGIERFRPAQTTEIPNLFLAGDWTATGWPATMEGAVRSGYLAAEAMLRSLSIERRILVPDLPAAPLSRWLLGLR
jgi:squalene-associated FAD-dependent desaturase